MINYPITRVIRISILAYEIREHICNKRMVSVVKYYFVCFQNLLLIRVFFSGLPKRLSSFVKTDATFITFSFTTRVQIVQKD